MAILLQIDKDRSIGFYDCECGRGGVAIKTKRDYRKGRMETVITVTHGSAEEGDTATLSPNEVIGILRQLGGTLWGHRN